jgi:NADH:ubiquinone oxidoreductase subunit
MGIIGKIFTWWDGATFSTMFNSALTGEQVGTDAQGNRYFRAKKPFPKGHPRAGQERRWVIYNGANDASRVPRIWEADYTPNATGTAAAYRPARARGKQGPGDYEAWSPEADDRVASLDA